MINHLQVFDYQSQKNRKFFLRGRYNAPVFFLTFDTFGFMSILFDHFILYI